MFDMLERIRKILSEHPPVDTVARSAVEANSAVLIPLFEREGGVGLVLIHRSDVTGLHRGQMGFPGGMMETEDDGDLLHTALREAEEELGILPGDVQVIGHLDTRPTIVSGLVVKPFIGIIPFPYPLSPDPVEVQCVHTADLGNLRKQVIRTENRFNLPPPVYPVDGKPVWGLTGRMITDLLEILRSEIDA